MAESKRYIVVVKQKNDGETKVLMKPIKKWKCCCCLFGSISPYWVILIIGAIALLKIDGCCPPIKENIVTTTNSVFRVEFKCIHCNCEKVNKSDGR